MKGDFSRDTFDPAKHFSRVLMQQGRVQLDADWNEQTSILLHYLRTLAVDLIGPYGGPANVFGPESQKKLLKVNCGFEIITTDTRIGELPESDDKKKRLKETLNQSTPPLLIGQGRYYVGGVLCENLDYVALSDQIGYPFPNQPAQFANSQFYLIYLDVWERHITSIEDGSIRESALGGPDTATRAKVVWQVKVTNTNPATEENITDAIDCTGIKDDWPQWVDGWEAKSACQLKVRLNPETPSSDPCAISPTSTYRGRENQLYRVEIHVGGKIEDETKNDDKTCPTFKWSRDNGSVVAAWLGKNDDGGLLVSSTHGFEVEQWIEIANEAQDLRGEPGAFFKIQRVEGGALYLDLKSSSDQQLPTWTKDQCLKVRRWDQKGGQDIELVKGAVRIFEPTDKEEYWINLENGLQIQFQKNGKYRTGDYWLIPARVTTGQIEWPVEVDADGQPKLDSLGHAIPIAQSPHGITHHYAPLAFIKSEEDAVINLRCTFGPLGTCQS